MTNWRLDFDANSSKCLVRVQSMVDIIKHGLTDENQKVKTITALTVSALAEAASPYGIESFDDVLEPLWKGIRLLRGKVNITYHCLRILLGHLFRKLGLNVCFGSKTLKSHTIRAMTDMAGDDVCRCWRRS